jgi:Fe-S cluster assembly protein SufD
VSLALALKTGDLAELPSRRDEDWRWTDLRGLVRTIPPASLPIIVEAGGPFAALGGEELAFGNGRRPNGDHVSDCQVEGEQTLRLRFVSNAEATSHSSTVVIEVEEGASLLLLESYEGAGSGYVASVDISLEVERGARVTRIVLVEEPADAILVSEARVLLHPGAAFQQTILTTGGRRQRVETRITHPGAGGTVQADGIYLLASQRHADLTSEVIHARPDGTTSQLIKGCVSGASRAVFQGRIVVSRGADGTDAKMGHHGLILSERAEIDAKPELEIYADDVACAHGNTVGALDDEALFYARSRGIPEAEARAMLTEAFVGEVVDRIEHDGARDIACAWVTARLGGGQ